MGLLNIAVSIAVFAAVVSMLALLRVLSRRAEHREHEAMQRHILRNYS